MSNDNDFDQLKARYHQISEKLKEIKGLELKLEDVCQVGVTFLIFLRIILNLVSTLNWF